MQIILCATYFEARSIIDFYGLSKSKISKWLVFKKENKSLYVVISGVGASNAAECTEFVCKHFGKFIQIINIGTCASTSIDKLYLAGKISSNIHNAYFYPDILLPELHKLNICKLLSMAKIATKKDIEQNPNLCFDMEAYYIFQVAVKYLGPHQMYFLKISSDNGINCKDNADFTKISRLQTSAIASQIKTIIDTLCAIRNQNWIIQKSVFDTEHCSKNTSITQKKLDELASNLRCSASMKRKLQQQMKYAEILNMDIETILADITSSFQIPVEHKKTGMKILNSIDKYLIEAQR